MSDTIHGTEMGGNFAEYVASERERIRGELSSVSDQRESLLTRQMLLEHELEAIDAYERAKTGKATKETIGPRTRRPRDGSRRQEIIGAIAASPNGMSRGELIEHFGVKGDKSGEMSISNALTALTKGGSLARENGRYFTPARDGETVPGPLDLRAAAE